MSAGEVREVRDVVVGLVVGLVVSGVLWAAIAVVVLAVLGAVPLEPIAVGLLLLAVAIHPRPTRSTTP